MSFVWLCVCRNGNHGNLMVLTPLDVSSSINDLFNPVHRKYVEIQQFCKMITLLLAAFCDTLKMKCSGSSAKVAFIIIQNRQS